MKVTILSLVIILISAFSSFSQTTEFTYQGSLKDGVNAANGNYDFEFRLFDALTGGVQHPAVVTRSGVVVTNGGFSVKLDFFSPLVGAFPGADRYLEIRVKNAGGPTYTTLAPRQKISGEPYAQKSLVADTASTATNSLQLGGISASQYVTTTNGGTSFIRNATSEQAASNFNISGDGTVGGNLRAGALRTGSSFYINDTPILSINPFLNTFLGAGSGGAITNGTSNSFFGNNAGSATTGGSGNAFFGASSGHANTTGSSNSFFGRLAGSSNTTGSDNAFFGTNAGNDNTTGQRNSFFGRNAGAANLGASDNAFFGNDAGLTNTTGVSNAFFGAGAGDNNTTGGSNSFFGRNAGGSNTTANSNAFFGTNAGVQNSTGDHNAFFGANVGLSNSTAPDNSFFGYSAGLVNSTGAQNSFFGSDAGRANTTAANNSFFGFSAGLVNTTGADNSFFGASAGRANTTGQLNAFFGVNSGDSNTSGIGNSFFGANSGTANSTGDSNSFFGRSAGTSNTTANGNSFFGYVAGQFNTTGTSNSFFGANAGDSNTTGGSNSFFGKSAGASNTSANSNSFFGSLAGTANTTGFDNSFFGKQAGDSNTTGDLNTFVGVLSGAANTTGGSNTFIGTNAGDTNTSGSSNTYVGVGARGSSGINNATAIGAGANVTASDRVVLGTDSSSVLIPGSLTTDRDIVTNEDLYVHGTSVVLGSDEKVDNLILIQGFTGITDDTIIYGDLTVHGKIIELPPNGDRAPRTTIDHPLDPANKTLTLASIQSPELMNVYSGNIVTDADGNAIVAMPSYADSLDEDFRYQLTVVGQFAQAIVFEKVKGNQFKIKTDKPNVEVSWLVTGIRKGAPGEKSRVPAEQTKTESERGNSQDRLVTKMRTRSPRPAAKEQK